MVIISGGSWAVGEWKFHKLSGPGIAHYFSCNDHLVINLALSGIGNIRQLKLLEELLERFTPVDDDVFYWLVHSPLVDVPTEEIYNNKSSLRQSIQDLLNTQLAFADSLAKKYNITINLIGANCDLTSVATDQFLNLHVVVPSWGQLLDEAYPASIFSHQTDHMIELKRALAQHRPDLLDEYHQIGGVSFSKRRLMTKLPKLFDSFHPTSEAHNILSNKLMNL